MSTLFDSVELAPRDPILGLNEQYNADTRPGKVNLGVGVYYDDQGRIPLLGAVRKAEIARIEAAAARGYLPIEGIAGYNPGAPAPLIGKDSPLAAAGRVLTTQALGGTGALKIGADFLRQLLPTSKVLISDPSWENHRALFERAGFEVGTYAYYDAATRGLNFDGMLAALKAAPANTVVVLHACCHNPTGVDPTFDQWKQIAAVVKENKLVPFLDIAYQGFGEGLREDAAVVRAVRRLNLTMFISSSSFSKSFSLYGERVGALTVVAGSKDEAARVLSQLKRVIRTNYSNSAHPWRHDRLHRAELARAVRHVGRGTRRHARPHPPDAQAAGREDQGTRRQAGLQLRAGAARHVLLLGPDLGPGGSPARRARRLRRLQRSHLRRRAQQRQHRPGGQGHRRGAVRHTASNTLKRDLRVPFSLPVTLPGRSTLAFLRYVPQNAAVYMYSPTHQRIIAMASKLTDRQQQILDLIRQTVARTGFPPTRAEIAQALGFRSPNAAEDHLKALARKGAIELTAGASRGIRLKDASPAQTQAPLPLPGLAQLLLPLVGRVAAGSPILAAEHVEREIGVDTSLFAQAPDYLLKVRGMSMRDAGILEGDLLAVKKVSEARNGQIVVARLGDDVTVKRLQRQNGRIELLPENPDFNVIVVEADQEFALEGIAVGLIRPHTLH